MEKGRGVALSVVARLGQTILIVAIVATVVFVLIHLAPGDPFSSSMDNPSVTEAVRAHWRAAYGLDRPIGEQYVRYIVAIAHGDFGWSFSLHRPVIEVLASALPNTLLLAGAALLLGFGGGVALALAQVRRANSVADRMIGAVATFFYAMPDFWLALMVLLVFAYWVPVLPAGGATDPVSYDYMSGWARMGDRLIHLVLPACTLALVLCAGVARYQRAELLRILPEDYLRTARAKGVSERRILYVHALRNALVPLITMLGLSIPVLLTGAVFVERVFAWPGMGSALLDAVAARDYPLVTAGVIVAAAAVAVGSLVADVLQVLADPRSRHA